MRYLGEKMSLTANPLAVKVVGLTVDCGTDNCVNESDISSGNVNLFVIVQYFETVHAVVTFYHVPYTCPEFVGLGFSCHLTVVQLVVEVVVHPVLSVYLYKEFH